ncbi:hypothetical protein [Aeromicrobium sp. 50.2.37]|uniref:hypothetical protein n=1 Tax=Aeromicrobium sp. 50.2.37 TaxID=2969305 RepID=UPI0021501A07|nr:hypothetical protein [Aeromicrobium sp. 50.2.37]MCR4512663.1 hypothetical protein [Aeromicrobium sp. 50.2.37]
MKKTPAKADLNAYDFKSSVTDLLDLDQKLGIIPEHSRKTVHDTLDQLKRRAVEIGWITNRQIVDNASALIGAVAHLPRTQVNQYLAREDADVAHRARNLLLASVLVGSRGDFTKAIAESVCAEVPALKPRSAGLSRPNVDDEIVLHRVWALILSEVGGKHGRRAAAVYSQCDAGMVPGETTMMRRSDAVLGEEPMLWAPGLEVGVAERVLRLDDFQAHLLREFVTDLPVDDPSAPLTYRPRKSVTYAAQAASASGILDRQREVLGLKQPDTTASSVSTWRSTYTETYFGVTEALQVSGRSSVANHYGITRQRLNPVRQRERNEKRKPRDLDF